MRFTPARSSECTRRNLRASAASSCAYACSPTRVARRAPAPGDREAARQDLVARALRHGHGLAREQRLVDLEAVGGQQRAVRRHLVARRAAPRRRRGRCPPARTSATAPSRTHACEGGGQQREPVERPLGADLLHDADGGVDHHHEAEERVSRRPREQHRDDEHAQDEVEAREDVLADDAGVAAARRSYARRSSRRARRARRPPRP